MNNFYTPNAKFILFFQPLFCQHSSAHLQNANALSNAYFAKELNFSNARKNSVKRVFFPFSNKELIYKIVISNFDNKNESQTIIKLVRKLWRNFFF